MLGRWGKLYWSHSVDGFERIEEANEDGSARRTLVTYGADPQLAGVVGLTIDVNGHRLYWVNSDSATMQYYELGSGKSHTLSVGGARAPALEVHGSRLTGGHGRRHSARATRTRAPTIDCCVTAPRAWYRSAYDADAQKGDAGACVTRPGVCASVSTHVRQDERVHVCCRLSCARRPVRRRIRATRVFDELGGARTSAGRHTHPGAGSAVAAGHGHEHRFYAGMPL
ncbi:hypothetical protein EVAR_93760_1 [Eumeta japonica]|uniref:Uncharacterized protein n=1 Tax=Eumeta variegata TaxID=151549 RepID=A0A4C2AJ28_EUMVA|nr:hypothetical protein EVAR_93760_1 [Eumeta japonica]